MFKKLKKYLLICAFILVSMLIGLSINLYLLNKDKNKETDLPEELLKLEQSTNYMKLEETYLYDPTHDKIYGVAKRAYQEGMFTLSIDVDLSQRSSKNGFQVYLGKPNTKESLKIGKIIQTSNRNFIVYQKNEDLSEYTSVFVMKTGDNNSNSLILEGKF